MNRLGPLFAFLVALLLGSPALAQGAGRHMAVRLVAETAAAAPGSTVTLAFVMRPRPGWHGYWRNPGDAGAEPRVAWGLPEGWRADPLQYPVPTRLSVAGLTNYVFEGDYALLATLRVPASAEPGVAFPVDARLDYLVCTDEVCVPETASVSTELRTGTPGAADPAFQAWRGALPRPLAGEARFESEGGRVRIAIPFPAGAALDDPYFYPGTLDALHHSAPQLLSPDRWGRSKACSGSATASACR